MAVQTNNFIALDVGDRRIGIAVAAKEAGFASPLTTLIRSEAIFDDLQQLLAEQHASILIVGLPRGLEGQETAQTTAVRGFVEELRAHISIPVEWQDEALTSKQAEAELEARGKKFQREDIDSLAATYILEDYLAANRQRSSHAV